MASRPLSEESEVDAEMMEELDGIDILLGGSGGINGGLPEPWQRLLTGPWGLIRPETDKEILRGQTVHTETGRQEDDTVDSAIYCNYSSMLVTLDISVLVLVGISN